MNELILVRYGDLILKGRNKRYFISTANDRVREKLSGLPVELDFHHDRFYVVLNKAAKAEVIERLRHIPGLYSFSLVTKMAIDYSEIAKRAVYLIGEETSGKKITFKVETKRADKTIKETSTEISQIIAKMILRNLDNLEVDVHNPELTLYLDFRRDGCYMYLNQIMGLGGFPIPVSGKVVTLLSGGIDSPVAAFLAMKKGMETELVHFESTPLTPLEAVQKTIDIAKVLAQYAPLDTIKLHLVPFAQIHQEIIANVPEPYLITIMRRMMIRIASGIMNRIGASAIVTGDSIGQVASQTLESLIAIGEVTDALILRPLSNLDKLDIIRLSREIGTMDISIRAFNDCCSVYVPKNPVIRPQAKIAAKYESKFEFDSMIVKALKESVALDVKAG
ncbi:MAG: tRNA 4-thiouridine(8) synthase ThiI, partial [Candidatus Izemoplasmatales bacterium]|nr:tRNA 4-thiouridine(8) synthase ThiI [Candidatus Izemoplasmatales bacterium]